MAKRWVWLKSDAITDIDNSADTKKRLNLRMNEVLNNVMACLYALIWELVNRPDYIGGCFIAVRPLHRTKLSYHDTLIQTQKMIPNQSYCADVFYLNQSVV